MRSAGAFSVAQNVAKVLRIIHCRFRISSELQRNRLLRPAANLRRSISTFELSELCRPALNEHPRFFFLYSFTISA